MKGRFEEIGRFMKNQKMRNLKFLLALPVVGGLLAPGAAWAANAKVCFEAEQVTSIKTPLKVVKPGSSKAYSGAGYLDIPWDKNKSKGVGQAGYRVNVKSSGMYYLWARTFWANGCGNSIAVSVNGGAPITLGEDGTYDKWHWVGGNARVNLKAGANTFVIHNRETGVRVDQVFLTQDRDYTPTGIRKPTT